MTKSNGSQVFSFGKLNIQTKLIGSMIPMVLMIVAVLVFMRQAAHQLEQAVHFSDEARLSEEINSNFQLAVSKGKNICILRDQKNKERALKIIAATHDSFQKLQNLGTSYLWNGNVTKMGD